MLCGPLSISWSELTRAAKNLSTAWYLGPAVDFELCKTITVLDKERRGVCGGYEPGHSPLLIVLARHRGRDAADQRDKIFALLSIALKSCCAYVPRVDYNATVGDVYRQLVFYEITVTRTLNVLRYCNRRGKAVSSSWVPDWSVARAEVMLFGTKTAVHMKPEVRFSSDKRLLFSRAILWDSIDVLLNVPINEYLVRPKAVEFLTRVVISRRLVEKSATANPYGSVNERINAFWQTFCSELLSGGEVKGMCLGYAEPVSCLHWLPTIPKHWKPQVPENVQGTDKLKQLEA